MVNTACNKKGGIVILDAKLNDTNFLLINFYNSNSESEQLSTFSTLHFSRLLEKVDDYNKKYIVFGGDFNWIFDCKFGASGENSILKKKSLAKLIEIKETVYLSDIWTIRNPNVRRFTFRQKHFYGLIERSFDFFSNFSILPDHIIKTYVLASFCTDHLPVVFSLELKGMPARRKGLWKFNNSLTSSVEYVQKMENQILKLYVSLTKTK